MKPYFLLCGILVSLVSNAQTKVRLFEARAGFVDQISFEYVINKDLNRAWISVVDTDLGDDEYSSSEEVNRVLIPNMHFDPTSNTVKIKTSDAHPGIDCAIVYTKGRGRFKSDVIQETGNCKVKYGTEVRTFDDGFHRFSRKYEFWDLVID